MDHSDVAVPSLLALNVSSSASAHQQLFYNLINEFSTFYSLKSKIDRRIIYFFIYYIMPWDTQERMLKNSLPYFSVCVQTINKILNSLCCQPHCIFLLFIINIISLLFFYIRNFASGVNRREY